MNSEYDAYSARKLQGMQHVLCNTVIHLSIFHCFFMDIVVLEILCCLFPVDSFLEPMMTHTATSFSCPIYMHGGILLDWRYFYTASCA